MAGGRQRVSWVHERDFCRAVDLLLAEPRLSGEVNLTAPNSVTNSELMKTLRRLSGAPFGLPASRWMLEAGAFFLRTETELILKSRYVVPKRLLNVGFKFQFPDLSAAAAELCQRIAAVGKAAA